MLGTLLSSVVFYMIMYGIQRLLELCDVIELIETDRKKAARKAVEVEVNGGLGKEEATDKKVNQQVVDSMNVNDPMESIRVDPEDVYEVDNDLDKFEIVTYHRMTQ